MVVLQVAYASDMSAVGLTVTLLVILTWLYSKESSSLALVYLVAWFNYFVLLVSLLLTSGKPSYLTAEVFEPLYVQALAKEVIFWTTLGLLALSMHSKDAGERNDRNPLAIGSPALLLVISIILVSIEIALSHQRYFSGYVEDSGVGTPMYEVAAMLFSLVLFFRGTLLPANRLMVVLEAIVLLLILYIAFGSGKRLALSFVAIGVVSNFRSKRMAFCVYFGFVLFGYVHGVVRDSLAVGGLSIASVVDGVFFTNQGGALHSSAVYLRLIEENALTVLDRALAFFSTFVGAIFLPVSVLPPVTQLNVMAMEYYPVQGNGGFIGVYASVYLGLFGPVLFAIAIACLAKSRQRLFAVVFAIVVLATIRWTMYNVAPLVRLIGYVLLIVYAGYVVSAASGLGHRRRRCDVVSPHVH